MSERRSVSGWQETSYPRSGKDISSFVELDTMIKCGFNYWEGSAVFDIGGRSLHAFISDSCSDGLTNRPNIIILQDRKRRGAIHWNEWYFGTFEGKPIGQRDASETDEYYEQVAAIADSSHQVAGEQLEALLEPFIPSYE